MRLGAYPCRLEPDSRICEAYGQTEIQERHRHRYEFNNRYLEQFVAAGMRPVGVNPESGLVEAVEVADHPWFVGVQFHPEYSSTVNKPHPLFVSFVKAALEYSNKN
jgi:CTP synthase